VRVARCVEESRALGAGLRHGKIRHLAHIRPCTISNFIEVGLRLLEG
jgi:hypothetical protein